MAEIIAGLSSIALPIIACFFPGASYEKPFQIAIAPSHITGDPNALFAEDAQWKDVREKIDLYKYYGVQLARNNWATQISPGPFVAFTNKHKILIGCEFGDFHLGAGKTMRNPAEAAIEQLQPIFDAGAEVSSIHLDGPIRRMIKGLEDNPNALSIDEICETMIAFNRQLRKQYPQIKIGLITNFPNWDFTEDLPGYNGHYTDKSGLTYLEALSKIQAAYTEAGEKIDFLEVDCPYNYYRETKTRNGDAAVNNKEKFNELHKWLRQHDIPFHLVVNAEPRKAGAQAFHDLTLEYINALHRDEIHPDLFIIQSWYKEPKRHLPSSKKQTFMNTAKESIDLIERLYKF